MSMSEHAKTTKGSSKKVRSLLIITIVLITAALAAGAAAVVTRQSAGLAQPGGREEGKAQAGNNSGDAQKRATPAATTTGQQVQRPTEELTPEEAQVLATELKPMLNKSSDGLQEVHHADGSVSIDVDDHMQSVVVAKVDKNGKVTQGCVDTPRAAAG